MTRSDSELRAIWSADWQENGTVRLRVVKRRLWFGLGGSAVFVAAGVILVVPDDLGGLFGGICVTLFGLVAASLIALQLVRPSGEVTVSKGGIGVTYGDGRNHFIPWPEFEGAFVYSTGGIDMVVVEVTLDFEQSFVERLGRIQRRLTRANRRLFGFPAIALPAPLPDSHEFAEWLMALEASGKRW
ncbi:hypothetical protein [Nocardioides sp. NPDC047086]|uniref:hypothetical protein n=1 Tax=Nocardioides sp. NPDC047086 TaxID=3154810 RepID=UPI003402A6E1